MIVLVPQTGRRERLRWTDQHHMSSYGLGVVLRAKSGIPLDGAAFAAMAAQGACIVCSAD